MSSPMPGHGKGAGGRRRSSVRFNLSDTAQIPRSPDMDWYPTAGTDWYPASADSDRGPVDRGPIDGDSEQELRQFTASEEDADEEHLDVCLIMLLI